MPAKSHGMSKSPEYNNWCAMRSRCQNKNNQDYADYGGRGIVVCERWNSFENFLSDMGHRPFPGATIERENVNGNYEPSNCSWASQKAQTRNKRNNCLLEFNGQAKPLAVWAEEFGRNARSIWDRVFRYGWTVERALTSGKSHRWSRRTKATV